MTRRPLLLIVAFAVAAATPTGADARGAAQDEAQEPVEALGRALGMTAEEVEALNLSPDEIENLLNGFTEEMVVVGSRAQPRTVTASPVPVDVLSTTELTSQGSVNLQDQLRTIVPSFAVNAQPISDASTVVRPAMLRNLAPDHTLVLVNGKRRHRSSVIDWHGGNGVAFGSQGPDISTIPAIALRQVEVLRDGAAAQYGSDAIAGVMNFQLKDAASGGAFEYNTGRFADGGGEAMNVAANAGLPLGATGFANLSLEYGGANPTDRTAPRSDAIALIAAGNTDVPSDTPQVWGSPDIDDDLKLFGNFGYTTAAGVQVYGHTNYAGKRVTGGFFFRNPNTRGGRLQPRRRRDPADRRRADCRGYRVGQLPDGDRHRQRGRPRRSAAGLRRSELLLVPRDVPRRLHAQLRRRGAGHVAGGGSARLHCRWLQLGCQRIARRAPDPPVHPRHGQRLARPPTRRHRSTSAATGNGTSVSTPIFPTRLPT